MVVSIAAVTEIQPETANSGAVQPPHGTTSSSVTAASNNSLSTKSRPSEGGQADATASLGGFANGKLNSSNLVNTNLAKANKAATAASTSTINSITLAKAGTGLDGEGGSNNTVLINNSAKWHMVLNLSAGTTTVTIEFPKGNVIENASVSSATGCTDGSKLEKTNGSYTNNKATCIIQTDSPKSQNLDITDYVFGGNGQTLAPTTITLNSQAYTGNVPAVTLKSISTNYHTRMEYDNEGSLSDGYNRDINFVVMIYADKTSFGNGAVGLDPLADEPIRLSVDMSQLPSSWRVDNHYGGGGWTHLSCNSASGNSHMIGCGSIDDVAKSSDGTRLNFTVNNALVGSRQYPEKDGVSGSSTRYAYYVGATFTIKIPIADLPQESRAYTVNVGDTVVKTMSDQSVTLRSTGSFTRNLTSSPTGWISNINLVNVAGRFDHWSPSSDVAPGESIRLRDDFSIKNIPDNKVKNEYECLTADSSVISFTGEYTLNQAIGGSDAKKGVEFGVLSGDGVPDPNISNCGKYGDSKEGFFKTYNEAAAYAKSHNTYVNAVRSWVDERSVGDRNSHTLTVDVRVLTSAESSSDPKSAAKISLTTDQFTPDGIGETYLRIVPGKIRPTLALSNNSSTSPNAIPNETEHITITPYAYAADTNVSAVVTLPTDISPVAGSYKYDGKAITPTSVTKNTDGTTTINFPLGTVGSKDANNTKQPDITMDVTVSPIINTPTTRTISVSMKGDGTSRLNKSWRDTSQSFSVAEVTGSYGYNLSGSSAGLLPGDSQTYTYTTYSNPDKDVPDKTMTTLSILPYNGDKNGTKSIKYQDSTLSLAKH